VVYPAVCWQLQIFFRNRQGNYFNFEKMVEVALEEKSSEVQEFRSSESIKEN
jgi:hypothetical protein